MGLPPRQRHSHVRVGGPLVRALLRAGAEAIQGHLLDVGYTTLAVELENTQHGAPAGRGADIRAVSGRDAGSDGTFEGFAGDLGDGLALGRCPRLRAGPYVGGYPERHVGRPLAGSGQGGPADRTGLLDHALDVRVVDASSLTVPDVLAVKVDVWPEPSGLGPSPRHGSSPPVLRRHHVDDQHYVCRLDRHDLERLVQQVLEHGERVGRVGQRSYPSQLLP